MIVFWIPIILGLNVNLSSSQTDSTAPFSTYIVTIPTEWQHGNFQGKVDLNPNFKRQSLKLELII